MLTCKLTKITLPNSMCCCAFFYTLCELTISREAEAAIHVLCRELMPCLLF